MRFLLVDRIAEFEPHVRITGWKNAAMSEDYLEWHFPGRPIVPGNLILEACAQLAGWLEAASTDFEQWFLLDRVASARYYAFAVPGDRIDLTLERVPAEDEGRRVYRAESRVGDTRGSALEFSGRLVPLDRLEDRDAARQTWQILRGEIA
jgi:3-hydroxyacyl-[acyl-carrier-protein] dehydratase